MDLLKSKKLFGERLVEKGLITREQLWEALRVQSRTGELLDQVLIRLGMVTESDVVGVMGDCGRSSLKSLDPELLRLIPEQLAKRYKVLPLRREGNRLVVAMADPTNVVAIDDLRLIVGMEIEPVEASAVEIEAAIQRHFGLSGIESAFADFDVSAGAVEQEAVTLEEEGIADEAPVVRLVNSILLQAIEEGASDIHIEPRDRDVRVRFRVDGLLREVMNLPRRIRPAVTSRIKIMSDMDIAEKRVPQDGRIQIRVKQREIDLRVSTLPTLYGEKVAIRILDKGGVVSYRLDQIGFSPANLERFQNVLRHTYGMVLVTGPTGSGKTTTLYATLNQLNCVEYNIVTIEDPVEYMLEGINQTQVNVRAGMTFAAGLRAILRQDPDIIMVGEIRDRETAEIAVRAANTGHLVLSTLHTNDAAGAITRLIDMGIEPFLVASSVLAVVAQRLVRLICMNCRQAYEPPPDAPERAFLQVGPDQPVILYRGTGCEKCNNTGYRGRLPIHEVLVLSSTLRPLVVDRAASGELKRQAVEEGMITMKEDGIQKAMQGLTTVQEVMRVAYTVETD